MEDEDLDVIQMIVGVAIVAVAVALLWRWEAALIPVGAFIFAPAWIRSQ